MEDLLTQTPNPAQIPTQPPQKNRSVILSLASCFAVAVIAGGSVYYWQHQKVNNLNTANTSLALKLATAQNTSKVTQPSASSTGSTVSYKANIGMFTLTLPNKYVVIVGNDGGGANGETQLTIGDKTADSSVVGSALNAPVTIEAYGLHGRSFDSLVNGYISDKSPFGKTTVQIDGVAAESYMFGGAGAPKGLYFTKGDMFYRIELGDTGGSIDQKLSAIVAGFKFN